MMSKSTDKIAYGVALGLFSSLAIYGWFPKVMVRWTESAGMGVFCPAYRKNLGV